jgi:serine/threonine protein kinase
MAVSVRRISIDKAEKEATFKRWEGSILDLEGLGHGVSGMVFVIDECRVIKAGFGSPGSKQEIETERTAYRILQQAKKPSPHILKCFDSHDPRGLVLERCEYTVRHRLIATPKDSRLSDLDIRIWAKQAAEGLAFIHEHGIIQGDVGCHNMLLDSANVLKLCDFAGSSVLGSRAAIVYEVWSRLSHKGEPTRKSDLFALGSAIYEMSTKQPPYRTKPYAEIPKLYQSGRFPSVKRIASLGNVIRNCWLQKYSNAVEVVNEIDPKHTLCCKPEEGDGSEVRAFAPKMAGSSSTATLVASSYSTSTASSNALLSTLSSLRLKGGAKTAIASEIPTANPSSALAHLSHKSSEPSTRGFASLSDSTSPGTNRSRSMSTSSQSRATRSWRNKVQHKHTQANSTAHKNKIQGILRRMRTGIRKTRQD